MKIHVSTSFVVQNILEFHRYKLDPVVCFNTCHHFRIYQKWPTLVINNQFFSKPSTYENYFMAYTMENYLRNTNILDFYLFDMR